MSSAETQPRLQDRISTEEVRELFAIHSTELVAFLAGVLRDPIAAQDVSQIAFSRLLELGHTAQKETIKGWLFQVAMREALDYRRRMKREQTHIEDYGTSKRQGLAELTDSLALIDEVERIRKLLGQLPAEQQEVVSLRIHENKTFAIIAAELNVPLGTVLTRMRLATEKLRSWLGND